MRSQEIQKKFDSDLSAKDRNTNAFRAGLQLIPNVGGAIDRLMFGSLDDLRSKRMEDTLKEIGVKLEELGLDHYIDNNEDFGNLLQDVAPPLSRSSNEDRRRRFRDLILNATQIPAGDVRWEEVHFASKLLDSIDAPGLAILAALVRCKHEHVWIFSQPIPYVHDGEVDVAKHDWRLVAEPHHGLQYDWTVIEETVWRLKEMRLIGLGSSDARGGFGAVALMSLGKLLV